MNPPVEPVQMALELPAPPVAPRREEPSDEFAAWVARKRRERDGYAPTAADRWQITRQLEDL